MGLTWFQLFSLILAIAEVVEGIQPEVVGLTQGTQPTATLKLRQLIIVTQIVL
jgi:hypothetical protein